MLTNNPIGPHGCVNPCPAYPGLFCAHHPRPDAVDSRSHSVLNPVQLVQTNIAFLLMDIWVFQQQTLGSSSCWGILTSAIWENCSGLNKYQGHFEEYLRYLIQRLCYEFCSAILAVYIEAPTVGKLAAVLLSALLKKFLEPPYFKAQQITPPGQTSTRTLLLISG